MATPYVTGYGVLSNGEHDAPETDLAIEVLREAMNDAGVVPSTIDGLYMGKPRPWARQGFFSTAIAGRLGITARRTNEISTAGTSSGVALRTAVEDIQADTVDTAVVFAIDKVSSMSTEQYYDYATGLFDHEFQAPTGISTAGVYAMSLRRYLHEYDVRREDIASVVVKNRSNATANPIARFRSETSVDEVLDSRTVADPLRLYECPALCDGAAALVLQSEDADDFDDRRVKISGTGYHHAASHFIGKREQPLVSLPAVPKACDEAVADAGTSIEAIDCFELYAPFPHIEAMATEELGLFEPGEGAVACANGETAVDGQTPVSPSGGCVGRGHPAYVTPLLNHIGAVKQLRRSAPNQIPDAQQVLTTSEHGHVDGVNATVFERGEAR